ncbi:DUF4422 domain-containing protein [Acetobacteraceae bacterium H6797]|nr:DUF4422 domain-containing protein [Acetobacteraceae bacterium H6797]
MLFYVISHKRLPYETAPPFQMIYTGSTETLPGEMRDSEGDSIAARNPCFSELTGQYWAWKNVFPNLPAGTVVGFLHYRRYFNFGRVPDAPLSRLLNPMAGEEALRLLGQGYDAIIPEPFVMLKKRKLSFSLFGRRVKIPLPQGPHSLREQYRDAHVEADLEAAIALLPEEHRAPFERHIEGNRLHAFNIYVAPKETLDRYFNALFPWLLALDDSLDLSQRSVYQARVCAFLAERFASYYFTTKLKVVQAPIVKLENV